MRKRWACPDLGQPKEGGYEQPVSGSKELFPDCPAYYLRTRADDLPADHLIDDTIHPASLVQPMAMALESGAKSVDDLPPKVSDLAMLWLREKASRFEYEQEESRRKQRAGVK